MEKLVVDLSEASLSRYTANAPNKKGANSAVSEQREIISVLIGKPFRQVCGLTRGMSAGQLVRLMALVDETMNDLAKRGIKGNKAAIWWNTYKRKYGNKSANERVGSKRRSQDKGETDTRPRLL